MVDSRSKGAKGEREVVTLLHHWWAQLEPEVEFARTPGSGGWQGQNGRGEALRGKFRMSGDVMTTSARFPFSVEVKRREEWTLRNLVLGRQSPVWGWWCQCQKAAGETTPAAVPMVWLRRSKEPWWVMLPVGFAMQVAGLSPEVAWTARQLLSVDAGVLLPALFKASAVVLLDPMAMMMAYQEWLIAPPATTRVVVG